MFLFKSKSKQETSGVPCRFGYYNSESLQHTYTCFIENQEQINNHIDQLKVTQQHETLKNNNYVQRVEFTNCGLTEVPNGLKKLFPNFNELTINGSDIETITKQDLDEYKDLKKFACMDCKLKYLPGDLFQSARSIQFIHFEKCNLKFIEPNILDELYHLQHVKFCGDSYYSKCYSIYPQYNPNATLRELKDYLYVKLYEKHKPMLDLKISEGIKREKDIIEQNAVKSHQLVKELEASEVKLKTQLKQLQESEKSLNHLIQQIRSTNETIKKENSQLKQSNNNFEHKLQNIEENFKKSEISLNRQIQQIRSANGTIKKENGQLKQSNNNFEQKLQKFKNIEDNLKKSSKQEIDKIKADKVKEVQNLKDSQTKLIKQIQQLENSEKNLKDECQRLKVSNNGFEEVKKQLIGLQIDSNNQVQQLKISNNTLKKENQDLKKVKLNLEEEKAANIKIPEPQAGLLVDITAFIQGDSTKDIKIIIDDREFPVHKFLLAARSPTLAEILKNNPEVENLNLVDISVDIFEIILKFLYTDELPGDEEANFLHLFAAAGKLRIKKLVEHAAGYLIDHVDEENALEILRLSASFKLDDLKLKAFESLNKKFGDIKFEVEWLENPEKLIKVVTMLKKKEEILRKFEDEFKEATEIK